MARRTETKKWTTFALPALPFAKAHRDVSTRLAQMSSNEILKAATRAGIYTRAGNLASAYKPEPKKISSPKQSRSKSAKRQATAAYARTSGARRGR